MTDEVNQDVIVDGRETPVIPPKIHLKLHKEKGVLVDKIVIEHKNGKTGKITRHVCNSSLKHRILKFLHLAHNCIIISGTGGATDIANLITGLAAPAAYIYIGIGTGTTGDASTDTKMQTGVLLRSVTPTITNSSGSLQDICNWTHVFSKANDASLTGFTSAVNEVAIENISTVATAGHILIHVAGGTNYGSPDSCNWDGNDTLTITITLQIKQGT